MIVAPNIRREGVVAGFAMALGSGLHTVLGLGCLFAQGAMWLPSTNPTVPVAPASALSWLAYNTSAGLYWTSDFDGDNAGDAIIGWARTNATDVIAVSNQFFPVAVSGGSSMGTSPGMMGIPMTPAGAGTSSAGLEYTVL